jgi:hypothetical protein
MTQIIGHNNNLLTLDNKYLNTIQKPPSGYRYLWNFEDNLTDEVLGLDFISEDNPPSYGVGKIGQALFFTGGSIHIATTNATCVAIFDHYNPFSISLFGYYVGSVNQTYFIIGRDFNQKIVFQNNLLHYGDRGGNEDNYGAITAGWHHIALTYDNTTSLVYIDNELRITDTNNQAQGNGSGLRLTWDTANGNYIDLFYVYDRCLTPVEVKQLWYFGEGVN